MRYLNSRGALSDGAMKVIDNLAMIKYPTPPTEDNPCGTLSYLPARAQWAELQILKIQRTMVDPGAIPIKSGIAEPGQLQKKINHCLENQKGHYLRNGNTGKCSCCNSSQDDLISF